MNPFSNTNNHYAQRNQSCHQGKKRTECFKYEKRYALIKKMKLTLNTANKFKEGKREETGKYR